MRQDWVHPQVLADRGVDQQSLRMTGRDHRIQFRTFHDADQPVGGRRRQHQMAGANSQTSPDRRFFTER